MSQSITSIKRHFSITSENETADSAIIWTEGGEVEISFNETYEEVLLTHDLNVADIYIVTVFDGESEIHKHAKISISGSDGKNQSSDW